MQGSELYRPARVLNFIFQKQQQYEKIKKKVPFHGTGLS